MTSQSLVNYMNFKFPTVEYLIQDIDVNIDECNDKLKEWEEKKREIDSRFPVILNKIQAASHKVVHKMESVESQVNEAIHNLNILEQKEKESNTKSLLQKKVKDYKRLVTIKNYLMNIQKLLLIKDQISKSTRNKEINESFTYFENIVNIHREFLLDYQIKMTNIIDFSEETTAECFKMIFVVLRNELQEVYKSVGWPNRHYQDFQHQVPNIGFLKNLIKKILEVGGIYTSVSKKVMSQLLQAILEPLVIRIRFHFMSDKNTSRLDKPEWMYKHVLDIFKEHQDFFYDLLQPLFMDSCFNKLNSKTESARFILNSLVKRRIIRDLPKLIEQSDKSMFLQYVYETMKFERDLRDQIIIYNHEFTEPWEDCITLFQRDGILDYWMETEYEALNAKLASILDSKESWELAYTNLSDIDSLKATKSVELFISLMETIIDKFSILSDRRMKLRVLDRIMLRLINQYLEKIRKSIQEYSQTYHTSGLSITKRELKDILKMKCRFLSSILHLSSVYIEWEDLPFFLELSAVLGEATPTASVHLRNNRSVGSSLNTPISPSPDESKEFIFSPILVLHDDLTQFLLKSIKEDLIQEYTVNLWSFDKRTDWSSNEFNSENMTISFGIFEAQKSMNFYMKLLHENIPRKPFLTLAIDLAKAIDKYLFENIVLKNQFGIGGIKQLELDLTECLWKGEVLSFFHKPENLHRRLKESLMLLRVSVIQKTGETFESSSFNVQPLKRHPTTVQSLIQLLVKESEESVSSSQQQHQQGSSKVLLELGITTLNIEQTIKVLKSCDE